MELTSTHEKVLNYLKTHVTPVAAETLAKRFIMSHSKVSSALKDLHDMGLASVAKVGKKKFYSYKSQD